jgi:hypothetical protein
MISKIALPTLIISLLPQPFACANVDNSQREEKHRRCEENNVQHGFLISSRQFPLNCRLPFLDPTSAGVQQEFRFS